MSPASDEEIRIAIWLMDMVDNGKASTLSLDSAVTILAQRGLPLHHLYKIWPLADRDNKKYLTGSELTVAVRLIGWAQAGHEVAEELVKTPGPLPNLRGITELLSRKIPDPGILPLTKGVSTMALKTQNAEKAFDFITNEKFRNIFLQETPTHGMLSREQILEIFISRFSIPHRILARIFEIIDFGERNALDIEHFCLGMHILEAFDSSSHLVLPPTISANVYNQLMHLESLIPKARVPSADGGTDRSASIDHQRAPSQIIPSQLETVHHSSSEQIENFPIEGHASLSTEIEEDMHIIRCDLAQVGRIRGASMAKFRLRYGMYPIEIARIWNSIPGHDAVPVSPETIEAAVKCIRIKLTGSSTAHVHSRAPDTSASHSLSETDTDPLPDFAFLPNPVASPGSEYSSSLDTASPMIELTPFIRSSIISPALARNNVQHETSYALLRSLQESSIKLAEDKDDLRRIIEAQTNEISEIMKQLKQAKQDITQLASASTSPDMNILHLCASLQESQAEVERMKEDAEKLQETVGAQKAEISHLNATISQQSSAVKYAQGPQNSVNDALNSLGYQVQEILHLMERVIKPLDIDDNPTEAALASGRNFTSEITLPKYTGPPIEVVETLHPTCPSPPSYDFKAVYSGSQELSKAQDPYQQAPIQRKITSAMANHATYPSPSMFEFPSSTLPRPPDYMMIDPASSSHKMRESKGLYSDAIETGRPMYEERPGVFAHQYGPEGRPIDAMDDAHHLRHIVRWQENRIMELNRRLEGHSNFVVSNPDALVNVTDSGHGPVRHFTENPFHRGDNRFYQQESKSKGNLLKYIVSAYSSVFKDNKGGL